MLRVRLLYILFNANVGMVMLYLEIQLLLRYLSCNRSWVRKLGRHCYFLNLVFFLSDDSVSMHAMTNIDVTSREHILYSFVTTCHGRSCSELFISPMPFFNGLLCFHCLCLGYMLLECLAGTKWQQSGFIDLILRPLSIYSGC